MKRREFTIALAAGASLLAVPFCARAANLRQLAPTGQKPPAAPPLESAPEPPASGAAWGELLATLPPARRLGFVIEQLVLCKSVCFSDIFQAIEQVERDQAQFGWPRRTTVEQLHQVMQQRPSHTEGLPPSHIRLAVNAFVRADRGQAPPLGEAQYSAIHAVACADYRITTGGHFVPGSAGPVRYIAKANAEAFARFNALRQQFAGLPDAPRPPPPRRQMQLASQERAAALAPDRVGGGPHPKPARPGYFGCSAKAGIKTI